MIRSIDFDNYDDPVDRTMPRWARVTCGPRGCSRRWMLRLSIIGSQETEEISYATLAVAQQRARAWVDHGRRP